MPLQPQRLMTLLQQGAVTMTATTSSAYLLPSLNGSSSRTQLPDTDEENYLDKGSQEFIKRVVAFVVPISFGLIGLIGLIGNSLVVAVVACNTSMRSTTNILIINLAVADLLFVIFCIPFTGTDYVLPYWPFGNIWCKCVQYMIVVTACASVYTLVLMSFDRYLAVVHPVSSRSLRTERKAIIAILIIWTVILTSAIPVFMIHGEVTDDPSTESGELMNISSIKNSSDKWYVMTLLQNETQATIETLQINKTLASSMEFHTACRVLNGRYWRYFQWIFFAVSYCFPLLLIIVLYMLMLIGLWQAPRISADGIRGRRRVTRLVIYVVGVFACSWAPIQFILVCKSIDLYPHNVYSIMFQIASHVLAYANSCINPILYAFLSENFRKAFRKAMYCRWLCRNAMLPDQHNNHQTRTTRIPSSGQII